MTIIVFEEGDIVTDAQTIAETFSRDAAQVLDLLRSGAITSRCERGADNDEGLYRISLFYGNRWVQLIVDKTGASFGRMLVSAPRPPPCQDPENQDDDGLPGPKGPVYKCSAPSGTGRDAERRLFVKSRPITVI